MNIQKINQIVDPHIKGLFDSLRENSTEFSITLLKQLILSKVDENLNSGNENISHVTKMEVAASFSGRGKAWAKVVLNEECEVWTEIISRLSVGTDHPMFKEYTGLRDLFVDKGFAWIRYGSAGKVYSTFKVRYMGSRSYEGFNIKIKNDKAINLENLSGVPQTLGLEDGLFANDSLQKVKEISKEKPADLGSFGIMTIEDMLGEDSE